MQTLHLRFRDLRAILLGGTPSRWPAPSMPRASTWKGPPPLPNLPSPTSAVGTHPKTSHQRLERCPTLGAGVTIDTTFREPCICGAVGANGHTVPDTRPVCWSQTAENNPRPLREPNRPPDDLQGARLLHHKVGQGAGCSLLARISEVWWTASHGLSFSIRLRRCQRALRYGARAGWKMTSDIAGVAFVRQSTHRCYLSLAGG